LGNADDCHPLAARCDINGILVVVFVKKASLTNSTEILWQAYYSSSYKLHELE